MVANRIAMSAPTEDFIRTAAAGGYLLLRRPPNRRVSQPLVAAAAAAEWLCFGFCVVG